MRATIIILLVSFGICGCMSHATVEPASLTAGSYIDPNIKISEGGALLQEGDLVVRMNQDPVSLFIKNFNRHDKKYSHAGIVLFENGHPFIYHIVNGEENPDEKLRRDSISAFCNPRKNTAFGIYRFRLEAGEITNLKKLIHQWYAKKIRFDHTFNLKSDDSMYCSEMVSKALERVTHQRIQFESNGLSGAEAGLLAAYLHLPLAYTAELRIVSIDNLYTNPACRLIKGYNFSE